MLGMMILRFKKCMHRQRAEILRISMISSIRSMKRDLVWLLLPFSIFALVVLFVPFRFAFELDTDEGINLIKAQLVTQGADLYTEIWSDQPPLFTILLAGWIQAFGLNLTWIRLLILLLSCTLVWAIAQYLRVFWGSPHAIAGVLIVALLPSFLILSVSIMIGLPAIVLAMLAFLAISYWHKDRKGLWLILSAIALGLSVMTKLFTGFLAPIFLIGLIAQERQAFIRSRSWRALLKPGVIWMAVFAITSIPWGLALIYPDGFAQLVNTHLAGRISEEFLEWPETIATYLTNSLPIIFLGIIGCLHIFNTRRWTGLYLVSWALASYLLLAKHAPIWYHHELLVTIPIAALCGIAIGEFLIDARDLFRNSQLADSPGALLGIIALFISYLFIARVPSVFRELDPQLPNLYPPEVKAKDIPTYKVLELMREYADVTNILITDRPMLAIRLGKPIPPNLAVLTGKRLMTGEITEDDIISEIERYQPEQVALARFNLQQVDAYLKENYRLAYKRTHHRLYIRSDLLDQTDPTGLPGAQNGFSPVGANPP